MGAARLSFARLPATFWKLCGSGTGEGFTPVPNTQVWAILAVWESDEAARSNVRSAKVFQKWRTRADEDWTIYMTTSSVRGAWSGKTPFEADGTAPQGPLAALTRATIRPGILARFWGRVPDISGVIGSDPNVAFKIGIGEVPWFHQITFSVWPDTDSMAHFARKDGPHAQAIRAVRDGNWFSEELYARFRILGAEGRWNGEDPLARLKGQTP